jgi:hypothetical protein
MNSSRHTLKRFDHDYNTLGLHNFLKRTIGLRSCVQTVIEIGEVAVEGTTPVLDASP